MPALSNERRELFAQALAQGKAPNPAYKAAGYNPNRSNAMALARHEAIVARVAEIRGERGEQDRDASETTAALPSLSKELILSRLWKNHVRAAEAGNYSVSVRALELIGREAFNMFTGKAAAGGEEHTAPMKTEDTMESLRLIAFALMKGRKLMGEGEGS